MKKTVATLTAIALIGAAFIGPAEAKKKKKKKKPPVPVCQEYVPGEMGAEAETFKVTDEHTAEAPLEVTVTHEMTFADFVIVQDETHYPFNVQVDSKAKEAGLYVSFEFDTRRDYDLYMYYPNGDESASSHGFNPLIEANVSVGGFNPANTDSNHAGETKAASENLIGVRTADCQGWTVDTVNWFGEGGDFSVKVWLGEIVNDPLPQENP